MLDALAGYVAGDGADLDGQAARDAMFDVLAEPYPDADSWADDGQTLSLNKQVLVKVIVCVKVKIMPASLAASGVDLDAAFAALGDPVRRALVIRLARSDASVGELAEPFDLTQQAISHHVGVLRRCGLVEQRREGTRRPCRLKIDQLSLLSTWIDDQRRAWDDRLNALEQHLTDGTAR